jgi:Fe2+ or Zn2+ uptake regulation protein
MKIMGRSGIPDILQFKRLLRDKDLKATPQRMAVHEAMSALGHASAEEVSQWIAEHGEVSVSPASVYNILSSLADLGIYGRCSGRAGRKIFDVRGKPHFHLYDTRNEAWRDLEDPTLLSMLEAQLKGRRFRGYRIEGFELQLLCRPTRKLLPSK